MKSTKRRKPTADTVSFQKKEAGSNRFSVIIAQLAKRAKRDGLDAKRVDKAVELVLHPNDQKIHWEWADAVTLRVRSQSHPERWYQVDGQCGCADYKFRGGPCKHQIARDWILRAEEQLVELPEAGRVASCG